MIKVVAIIPARSGSKGVPHKNIRKVKNHSLLDWSISACKKCNNIDDIYISTDSEEYQNIAISLGGKAPFLRPKEFSTDMSTDYEMIKHFLDWMESNKSMPDYLVHIRPTTPLRDPIIIDNAIKSFIEDQNSTALRSVHLMSESAYKTFEISKNGNLKPVGSIGNQIDNSNKPRQLFPKTYVANGYVDVLKTNFIIKFLNIHGDAVMPFLTPHTVEIDCEQDFKYLNFLIEQYPNIIKKLFS